MGAGNGMTQIVAKQQRANAAMADNQHIAIQFSREQMLDFANNSDLGINCAFPAANAHGRTGKKLVCHNFKLGGRKITGRRSVVFMHPRAHLDIERQSGACNLGGLDRLALGASDDPRRGL